MILIKPVDEREDQPWVAVPGTLEDAISSCLRSDEYSYLVGEIDGFKAMILRGELYVLVEIEWCHTILEKPAGLRKTLGIMEPATV